MCGIVGFVDPRGRVSHAEDVLVTMRDALSHRGPDQAGAVHRGFTHFGHRRLSIVDPSEAGRQPFLTEGMIAVANGEIYNHVRLRKQLQSDAIATPIPPSDCAILPHLWRTKGLRFIDDLDGMYALAMFDETSGTLILARDPAGQKPLYFAPFSCGGLAFASEVKALLKHPLVTRNLNQMALRQYLAFDYVPGDLSIYSAIQKLPPGSALTWRSGTYRVDRTYHPPSKEPPFSTLDEASNTVWQTLVKSVEARLMADVPLGVFLSGGVDSAAIVAALREHVDGRSLRTYAIGFDEHAFDESPAAEKVASHFGTNHRTEILRGTDVARALPDIMATLDEPFADASYVPTYLLSQFVAKEVKVILGGDGGDELFLGYPTFYAEGQVGKANLVPKILREKVLLPIVGRLSRSDAYMPAEFRWRRFLRGLELPALQRHVSWTGGIDERDHSDLLQRSFKETQGETAGDIYESLHMESLHYVSVNPNAHSLELLAHQYLRTYLAEGVLQKVDRASMAHGLEVRSPFLSKEMMAVAAQCSVDQKIKGRKTKRVLRHALNTRLPAGISSRPKRGFALPLSHWLRTELRSWMLDMLHPTVLSQAGIFDPETVARWVNEHLKGHVSRHKELWTLLAFETWRQGPHGPSGK